MLRTIMLIILTLFIQNADGFLFAQEPSGICQLGRVYNFWDHGDGDGSPGAKVKVMGNFAYVTALTSGMQIIDISSPDNLHLVGNYDCNWSATVDVAVVGNFAYLAERYVGMVILDISDPTNPVEVSTFETQIRDIFVQDDYAYIATGYDGLRIIDVSNPVEPIEVVNFETDANRIYVSDGIAYVIFSNCLRVINVTNPEEPFELSLINRGNYREIVVVRNIGYAVEGTALRVIDFTNPADPVQLGRSPNLGRSYDVFVQDNIAYVATSYGLRIVDISTPDDPVRIGSYSPGPFDSAVRSGDLVYAVDCITGLHVVSVDNPEEPELLSSICPGSVIMDFCIQDDFAYLKDFWGALRIVDISNLEAPFEVSRLNGIPRNGGIAVSGNYAYIVKHCSGIQIFDVADPASPEELELFVPESTGNRDIQIIGEYAFLVSNGLRVIDISNPVELIEVGLFEIEQMINTVTYENGYAYLGATLPDRLIVIDISDPENLSEASSCNLPRTPTAIAVEDNRLCIGIGEHNRSDYDLLVFDVSDPAEPLLQSELNSIGKPVSAEIDGDLAILTIDYQGLETFDISDIRNPVKTHIFRTPGKARKIIAENGIAFINDYTNFGIYDYGEALGGEFAHPEISVSPNTLDFGEVALADSSTNSIIIRNPGILNLQISSIALGNRNFSAVFDSAEVMCPGDSLEIMIIFKPENRGEIEGEITISSNDPDNAEIVVSLHGVGQDDQDSVGETFNKSIPEKLYLSPVYPNPFNSIASIQYSLPQHSEVTVKLFDLAGKIVETLYDGDQEAGAHKIVWNAGGEASGLYLVQVATDKWIRTQKIILTQ